MSWLIETIAVWGTVIAAVGAVVSVVLAYRATNATWFTDRIGWRYLCMVNGPKSYMRNLRLAKALPELKHLINRNCFWRLIKYPYWAVLFIVFAPLYIPYIIMTWISDRVSVPDPYEHAVNAVMEMEKVVPSWKMRKAMGLPYDSLSEMLDRTGNKNE